MVRNVTSAQTIWELPPLILHPFNEKAQPAELLENSRAALILSGLMPSDGADPIELERRVLTGRYAEVRMLYYLGKDVFRWIAQCMEHVERIPELNAWQIYPQSIAGLLTGMPPAQVLSKLRLWGVNDYSAIFSRAIGLNVIYREPPAFEGLSEIFLRHYHKYADHFYACFRETQDHRVITAENFRFELYASGEYSRMLETQWGD
jgi:hypothetical protein